MHGIARARGEKYFDHPRIRLIRFASLRGSRKREVDSGRKFNGRTAGIRMHAHSWLWRTRESGGREVRCEAWNGGEQGGEGYKRWKKGLRKHYERNKLALARATSHLSLAVYAVSQTRTHTQARCLYIHMCSRTRDIRYDIWYFGWVCVPLPPRDGIYVIILSLNELMILGTQPIFDNVYRTRQCKCYQFFFFLQIAGDRGECYFRCNINTRIPVSQTVPQKIHEHVSYNRKHKKKTTNHWIISS